MARRRMLSLTIVNSARFIKMPQSTQNLYFHLNLRADDDGIVEAYSTMRLTGSTEDDIKVLAAKDFVRVLNDDLVAYITDWNEHNLIRADRKVDSVYKDLLLQIIPDVKLLESRERADSKKWTSSGQPKDSIGKVSIGKVKIVKDSIEKDINNIILIWNNQTTTRTHKPEIALKHLQNKHRDIIKDYGEVQILNAIDSYAMIKNDDNYWFNYDWSLWDFITRGVDNFIDDARPKENYKKTSSAKQSGIDLSKYDDNMERIE